MNKKSLHTQHKIEKALFKLLETKSYPEITISQITRLAKVSRTSFYRNYEQKDSVISEFIKRRYDRLILDIKENHLDDLSKQLIAYLSYFKENPTIMPRLLDAGFEGMLLNEQTIYLNNLLQICHPGLKLEDYAISYQSGGIFMLLVWWVKQNYQTPLEDLVAYAHKHIMI
ncbi:TetR/AcrR family transcriptional regulator [Lactobacillus hamsteri]|uniref:Transcriptional regulator n=1 Tax=Lactobacillus hamsteri DSM 5661 = JCM 6256 TaxID=1423754 RepID=A0A0R1YKB1_9LACO|nr:TetR/AcrR family transcriptional regulator [Lactobacillus hamsteri]KRM40297.1 transcriptional regulator [Lactobacillus hamsteri DSM 5661 = JCM 6256]